MKLTVGWRACGRAGVGVAVLALLALLSPLVYAQSSTSYRLSDVVLNLGGRPSNGSIAASSAYRLTLDSVGDSRSAEVMSSASYRMDHGVVAALAPVGEVGRLWFRNAQELNWTRVAGSPDRYNVYRQTTNFLPSSYGVCLVSAVVGASVSDPSLPPPASSFFYLVSAENRLWEEGTLGWRSNGSQRPNTNPCP
jgi:hypothetical protein